ncbi:MAG: hypothetical protein SGILL_003728 [Bacillariaceae sp.]
MPQRQSSLRRQGSKRLSSNCSGSGSGNDMMLNTVPLRDDDMNGKSKKSLRIKKNTMMPASKWITPIIAWCILTTLYFTSRAVSDHNRSAIASRNLRQEKHAFAEPIRKQQQRRKTLAAAATMAPYDADAKGDFADTPHSKASQDSSDDVEEEDDHTGKGSSSEQQKHFDTEENEQAFTVRLQYDADAASNNDEEESSQPPRSGDGSADELAQAVAHAVVDETTLRTSADDSKDLELQATILEDEETIAMEISFGSDTDQPACDMLPLNGGRYFWRNRQRLVDLDKTEICGPKVLIIGAKKCGTTTIADMLMRHPRVQINSCNLKNTMGGCREMWFQGALKQGQMFDGDDFTHKRRMIPDGWLDEFGKRLPSTDGVNSMTIDKSPSYMDVSFFPDVAEYAKAHLPHAKIVATVCNPAERLYSHWKSLPWETHDGYKQLYSDNDVPPPTNFGEFVNYFHDESVCSEKEGFCDTHRKQYLKYGDYVSNLQPWYESFGEDNVMVVNMDDHPSENVMKLLMHIGHDLLPASEYPWNQVKEAYATNVNEQYPGRGTSYLHYEDAMKWLEEYYAPQNEDLAKKLGANWPLRWNCRLNGNCDQFKWES